MDFASLLSELQLIAVDLWLGRPDLCEGDISHSLLTKSRLNPDEEEKPTAGTAQGFSMPINSDHCQLRQRLQQGGKRGTKRTSGTKQARGRHKKDGTISNATEVTTCRQHSAAQLKETKIKQLLPAEETLGIKSD